MDRPWYPKDGRCRLSQSRAVEGPGIARMQPNAAVACGASEIADVVRAMNGIAALEED